VGQAVQTEVLAQADQRRFRLRAAQRELQAQAAKIGRPGVLCRKETRQRNGQLVRPLAGDEVLARRRLRIRWDSAAQSLPGAGRRNGPSNWFLVKGNGQFESGVLEVAAGAR
jgi:hypothetical protein